MSSMRAESNGSKVKEIFHSKENSYKSRDAMSPNQILEPMGKRTKLQSRTSTTYHISGEAIATRDPGQNEQF